jgi:hypothetical protein
LCTPNLVACRLQEESAANQEAKKLEIQAQIEAERRATEQYRVRLVFTFISFTLFKSIPNCVPTCIERVLGRRGQD